MELEKNHTGLNSGAASTTGGSLVVEQFTTFQPQLLSAAIHFFHRHIRMDQNVVERMKGNQMFGLFCEYNYYSNKPNLNAVFLESVQDCSPSCVCTFMLNILHHGIFSVTAVIVSVIYLGRFKERSNLTLHKCTWRPLFLVSLLVADKMCEDKPIRNSSLAKIFPVLTNLELNKMEAEFLKQIEFNVTVKLELFSLFCERLLQEKVSQEILGFVNSSDYGAGLLADNVDPVQVVISAQKLGDSSTKFSSINNADNSFNVHVSETASGTAPSDDVLQSTHHTSTEKKWPQTGSPLSDSGIKPNTGMCIRMQQPSAGPITQTGEMRSPSALDSFSKAPQHGKTLKLPKSISTRVATNLCVDLAKVPNLENGRNGPGCGGNSSDSAGDKPTNGLRLLRDDNRANGRRSLSAVPISSSLQHDETQQAVEVVGPSLMQGLNASTSQAGLKNMASQRNMHAKSAHFASATTPALHESASLTVPSTQPSRSSATSNTYKYAWTSPHSTATVLSLQHQPSASAQQRWQPPLRARPQVHEPRSNSRSAYMPGITLRAEKPRITIPAMRIAKVNATQTTPPVLTSSVRMKLEQSPQRPGHGEGILGSSPPLGFKFPTPHVGVAQGSSLSTRPGSGSPSVGSTILTSRGSLASSRSPPVPLPCTSYVGPTSVLSTIPPLPPAGSLPSMSAVPAPKVADVPGSTKNHLRSTPCVFSLGNHVSQRQLVSPPLQRGSFSSCHNRQPSNVPMCTTPSRQTAKVSRASMPSTNLQRNSHGVPFMASMCRSLGSFTYESTG